MSAGLSRYVLLRELMLLAREALPGNVYMPQVWSRALLTTKNRAVCPEQQEIDVRFFK